MTAAMLAAIHGVVLLPGFFAPYSFDAQNRDYVFAPPSSFHWRDPNGKWHIQPFVYQLKLSPGTFSHYEEDRSKPIKVGYFVTGYRYEVLGLFASERHLFGTVGNARIWLLGTDAYGRDEFSRLIYGGRESLFVGVFGALVAVCLGTLLGGIAGFYGGSFDSLVMRLGELFLSVPWLYLLLSVRAILPLDMEPSQAFLMLIAVLGVIGWARPARLIRGVAFRTKGQDYVLAARGFGASDWYILRIHVLPAAWDVMATQAALYIPQYVLAEVTLSFFGLGVGEPVPSWGNMLAELQQYFVWQACWWMFAPVAALVFVFLAYQQLFLASRSIKL